MSSGMRRVKSERMKKRKLRQRLPNRYDKDRRMVSMLMALEMFAMGMMSNPEMSMLSFMGKPPESTTREIEYPPGNEIYGRGIRLIGVKTFLSTAVDFCHHIARQGRMPIVSVGSGDGSIEKRIAETYRERYGEHSNLEIILVDPDPKYRNEVHYRYVDELIEERPNIVGHCAAFVIWPMQQPMNAEQYDLEAVRSLQPHGVLTVYESGGASGSMDFVRFLRSGTDDFVLPWAEMGFWNHQSVLFAIEEECDSYGLDHYEVYEVAQSKIFQGPMFGTAVFRMAIARRMDSHFVGVCPAINWTCRQQDLEFRQFLRNDQESSGLETHRHLDLDKRRMQFNMYTLGLFT